jgi:ferritin-like metal-binding protein YciE
MSKIERPHELLVAQLAELLYVEQQLANDVIPQLLSEVQHGQLKQGLTLHATQTHDHVANLRKAFELLGEEPKAEKNRALDGLKRQHQHAVGQVENPKLKDFLHAGAVVKTEHLEIAAYSSLIALAQKMVLDDVVPLLQENLADEESALETAEQVGQELAQEAAAVAATPS